MFIVTEYAALTVVIGVMLKTGFGKTRNIFIKDIQRHSNENIHLMPYCNEKMFYAQ